MDKKEQRNYCRKLFIEGKEIKEIASHLELSYQSVYNYVKDLKEPRFTYNSFSEKEKKNIVDMYNAGMSTVKIGKIFNVTNKVIARILDEFGIKRVGHGRRKYSLDENYFDKIDTPNKAYILGFLFADGSNNPSKSTVSISLQEEDKYILNAMKNEIRSEKELEFIDCSNKHDFGYNYKNQYRLLIFSARICNALQNIGMVQNKSLILKFPKSLNQELYPHFIRGYFDGDGSFCPHYTKDGKFQPCITFTSTEDFCVKLQEILKTELNIPGGNIYDASCHNGVTKVLSIGGANQTKRILDWIYSDAELYLTRKYNKYLGSFYNINNSISV